MKLVIPQKRTGRPPTGRTPAIAFRPPVAMMAKVDRWAAGKGLSRSEALRRLIELGLSRAGAPKRRRDE